MKYFGEFLVEQELITSELLAKALVTQVKALPSVLEIVYEGRLLTHDQLLSVFKIQNQEKTGFVEAATKLKLWNQKLIGDVEQRLQSHRVPLGEVLVNLKALSIQQVTKALDDFLGERQETPPATNQAGGDLMPASLKSELLECFVMKEARLERAKLEAILVRLNAIVEASESKAGPLFKDVLGRVTDLTQYVLQRKLEQIGPEAAKKIQTIGEMGVQLLWTLKDSSKDGADEKEILTKFCDGCDVLKFDIETVDLEA
jgi:hypothetical protein